MSALPSYPASERLRQVLGAFYKTVDVMKSARNGETKTMNVWADDMKAVEDVMSLLEGIRDGLPPSVVPIAWLLTWPDGETSFTMREPDENADALDLSFTPLYATPQPLAPAQAKPGCGDDCDFFNMLWNWFEDESRIGAEGMRPERAEGLTAQDFKQMLDEHESALLADVALKQPEPKGSAVPSTSGGTAA